MMHGQAKIKYFESNLKHVSHHPNSRGYRT